MQEGFRSQEPRCRMGTYGLSIALQLPPALAPCSESDPSQVPRCCFKLQGVRILASSVSNRNISSASSFTAFVTIYLWQTSPVRLSLVGGEPHWKHLRLSIQMRSVGSCLLNFTILSFPLFAMKETLLCLCAARSLRKAGGSWCRGAVTSSCRPGWRSLMSGKVMQVPGGWWEKWWGWSGEESGCPCSVWPPGGAGPTHPDIIGRSPASISTGQCCNHSFWQLKK